MEKVLRDSVVLIILHNSVFYSYSSGCSSFIIRTAWNHKQQHFLFQEAHVFKADMAEQINGREVKNSIPRKVCFYRNWISLTIVDYYFIHVFIHVAGGIKTQPD